MVDQLLHGDSFLGVDLEQIAEELHAVLGEPARDVVFALLDFFVQYVDVVVVEGEIAAEKSVEENAHAPEIGLGAQVAPAADELGRGVGWRSAARP